MATNQGHAFTLWSLPHGRCHLTTGLPVLNPLSFQDHFSLVFGLVDKLLSSSVTSVTYKIETLNDAFKVSISTFRGKTKIINFLLERLVVTVS